MIDMEINYLIHLQFNPHYLGPKKVNKTILTLTSKLTNNNG